MEYICQHCNANLDDGDIFEYFFVKYNDYEKAIRVATQYGWSENNRIHFNKSIIIQSEYESQYVICPDCGKKEPFSNKYDK
jgi:DNA-directed RNA polymerase subunit RPC12/RpoP